MKDHDDKPTGTAPKRIKKTVGYHPRAAQARAELHEMIREKAANDAITQIKNASASDLYSVKLSTGKLLGEATKEDLLREAEYRAESAQKYAKSASDKG